MYVGDVKFFPGIDPAPSETHKSDDGAIVIGAACPRRPLAKDEPPPQDEKEWWFDYCYARVFTSKERMSARQWSGMIHLLDQRFGFERILMDAGAGGGGIYVKRELMAPEQIINGALTTVVPICDLEEGPLLVPRGRFILHMFKRGDPGVDSVWPDPSGSGKSLAGDELLKDALYSSYKTALENHIPAWPPAVGELLATQREETLRWGRERLWALKNLDAGREQLMKILVETSEKDGEEYQVITQRGARKFHSLGKDDIALAEMYAYGAFRIWLRAGDWNTKLPEEDAVGFSGSG